MRNQPAYALLDLSFQEMLPPRLAKIAHDGYYVVASRSVHLNGAPVENLNAYSISMRLYELVYVRGLGR